MIALTSDYPATPNADVTAHIHAAASDPLVAWIAPTASEGSEHFPRAQAAFRAVGLKCVEHFVPESEASEGESEPLDRFDVAYLSGGNPLAFRERLQASGLDRQLRRFHSMGRLIVGASGGAMQLTPNLSLFRLTFASVEDAVAERSSHVALGCAPFELLPHLNRLHPQFLATVRAYSSASPHEIVALPDGAAVLVEGQRKRYSGEAVVISSGVESQP